MTALSGAEKIRLPRTGLALSRLGLGTAALADLYRQADEADAIDVVRAALDAGVTYLDTAPHYGLGVAEQRLGRALTGVDRDSYVLSTKVGRLLVPGEAQPGWLPALRREWDFSAAGVNRSLAESLLRLDVDHVDIAYLHDPDEHLDTALHEGLPALADLRARGAVRAIGVGTANPDTLARFVSTGELDIVLIAGRFTLLDQSALARLLPLCTEMSVAVVIGGVYNSGLLADPRPDAHYDYRAVPKATLDRALAMAQTCRRAGVPLKAAALRFPFAHPAVCSVLGGPANVAQFRENLAEFERQIPARLWAALLAEGLLPEGTPVPE